MELAAILTARMPMLRMRTWDAECETKPTPEQKRLRAQLKECESRLRENECLFNLETEDTMIDSRIYERRALLCRHRYLLEQLRQQRQMV